MGDKVNVKGRLEFQVLYRREGRNRRWEGAFLLDDQCSPVRG